MTKLVEEQMIHQLLPVKQLVTAIRDFVTVEFITPSTEMNQLHQELQFYDLDSSLKSVIIFDIVLIFGFFLTLTVQLIFIIITMLTKPKICIFMNYVELTFHKPFSKYQVHYVVPLQCITLLICL